MSQLYSGGDLFDNSLVSAAGGNVVGSQPVSNIQTTSLVDTSFPKFENNTIAVQKPNTVECRSSTPDDRFKNISSPDQSVEISSTGGRMRCNAPHPVRRVLPNSSAPPSLEPRLFDEIRHSHSLSDFIDSSMDDDDSLEFLNAKNIIYLTKVS